MADRLDLLTTGGSDFHGANKPWIRLGEAGERRVIPRGFYDAIAAHVEGRTALRRAGLTLLRLCLGLKPCPRLGNAQLSGPTVHVGEVKLAVLHFEHT